MVRSEGNMSLKNPGTPPGIDPGTVRLVAQRLNHYTTPGPKINYKHLVISGRYTVVSVSTCGKSNRAGNEEQAVHLYVVT
jgi:hypothetical protein